MTKLVKSILKLHNKENKFWKYKPNNYSEKIIKRNLENYFKFLESEKLPNRQRVIFGIPLMNESKNSFVGYSILNIFSNAKPIGDETKFGKELNYVYLRDFIIKPNYNKIKYPTEKKLTEEFYYSDKLLNVGIDIANKLNKEFICDILCNNKKMKIFLEKNGLFEDFKWKIKNNKNLISRMTH